MRLNKFISHNSKYSRREADALIEAGEVAVNRQVMKEFGYEVKQGDHVTVRGKPVKEKTEITAIVYNKPKGVLVTKKDDRGRTTIYHKLPGKFRHFIPVGRLDYASEGLLILTDNVEAATALMESDLERTYNLKIDKALTPEMVEAMRRGLVLEDASAGAHEKSTITRMEFAPFVDMAIRSEGEKFTKLRVTINEGKNRELRRFFAHFGANVLDLKRVAYAGIELNNLPENKTRYFTRREYDDLHQFLKAKKQAGHAKKKSEQNQAKQLEETKTNRSSSKR